MTTKLPRIKLKDKKVERKKLIKTPNMKKEVTTKTDHKEKEINIIIIIVRITVITIINKKIEIIIIGTNIMKKTSITGKAIKSNFVCNFKKGKIINRRVINKPFTMNIIKSTKLKRSRGEKIKIRTGILKKILIKVKQK